MSQDARDLSLLTQSTLEALPVELRASVDAHIKARLMEFYFSMVERGQIKHPTIEHIEGRGVTVDYTADPVPSEDRFR